MPYREQAEMREARRVGRVRRAWRKMDWLERSAALWLFSLVAVGAGVLVVMYPIPLVCFAGVAVGIVWTMFSISIVSDSSAWQEEE